jgi:hypothetical protein
MPAATAYGRADERNRRKAEIARVSRGSVEAFGTPAITGRVLRVRRPTHSSDDIPEAFKQEVKDAGGGQQADDQTEQPIEQ